MLAAPTTGMRDVLDLPLAAGEAGEHEADDHRRQERADQHGENRSAIARPVLQLLAAHDEGLGEGCCFMAVLAVLASPAASARFEAAERDERVLEVVVAGLLPQLVGRAGRDDLAARDHHDRVAERRHLLHHVAREQHGVAFALQAADDLAHRARAHHVEAVGRLVEQHVLRVVDEARASATWCARRARSRRRADRRSPFMSSSQQVLGAPAQVGPVIPAARRSSRCARARSAADRGPRRPAARRARLRAVRIGDRVDLVDRDAPSSGRINA